MIAPSRYPIRQPFAGGLESMVAQLVGQLRHRGHDVTLFAGEGSDGADLAYAFSPSAWEPSRAAAADSSMPAASFMADHHSYLRLLMALAGPLADRFDVVHNHSLHHLPVAMAPLLQVPMITTMHTPPTPWLESAISSAPASVGTSSRFVAVSRFIAEQWGPVDDGRAPGVVLNGIDLDTWKPGRGGEMLVWSGRIVPEKAPHLAIQAARAAGMPLVIAGPLSDLPYFEAQVRPHLGFGVRYAGHLAVPELADLVGRASAALVTPIWDEPYGLVVAEALACGTPVVAFRRGGIPEILTDERVGVLVEPGDEDGFAAAIPEAIALSRDAVRDFAERFLSLERMVSRYERLYARLASDARWETELPA